MSSDLARRRATLQAVRVNTRARIKSAMQIQDVPDRLRVLDNLRTFLAGTDREMREVERDLRLEAFVASKPAATSVRLQPAAKSKHARTVTRGVSPAGYYHRMMGR